MRTFFDNLKYFSEVDFRDIYKRFMYIDCRPLLEEMFPGELDDSITGFFAYCYIDRTEGISFRPFSLAALTEETLEMFDIPHQEDTLYVLRLRDKQVKMSELHEAGKHMYLYAMDPEQTKYMNLESLGIDTEPFSNVKEFTDKAYFAGDDVEELRSEKYAFLDCYRHEIFPDDVQVHLYNQKNGVEQVWVRLTFATDNGEIFGELLNEPYKDYGCHEGTLIEIAETKAGDGNVLVFTGRTARLAE